MVDRRNTPDILGDLLGGSPSSKQKEGTDNRKSAAQSSAASRTAKNDDVQQNDPQYFENLLEHAASALVLVGEVLGHQRLNYDS